MPKDNRNIILMSLNSTAFSSHHSGSIPYILIIVQYD